MSGVIRQALRRLALAGAVIVALATVGAFPAAAMAAPLTSSCGVGCVVFNPTVQEATGAADAAVPLNRALAGIPAGVTFRLPAGTYRLARPVVVPTGIALTGAGMDSTRLVLDRRNWGKFGFSFMVTPASNGVNASVADLTVDGNRVAIDQVGAGFAPAVNQGGGVKAGSGWTVQRVRFSNLNYFKLWVKDATEVKLLDNRFEDLGTGKSGGNDNIGGGTSTTILIKGNVFTARSVGNSIDLVRCSKVTVEGNLMEGTAAAPHNLYFEGVTDSTVVRNRLIASSISVQSNANYASATEVINPRGVAVVGNVIDDPAVQGISLRYDIPRGTTATGGANTISDNTVTRPGTAGVIVLAAADGLAASADRITGNTVIDAFARGTTSWNCGYGVTRAAGIVIGAAAGSEVGGNTVVATRTPAAAVGVQYGLVSRRGVQVTVVTSMPNAVVGIAVPEVRV